MPKNISEDDALGNISSDALGSKIILADVSDEMKKAYIDYSMSVIVSRAIPDVRDGLKPVQRRILYTMCSSGLSYNKQYKKSVKTVGDVMGSFHPHGNEAIYLALVYLARNWTLRYPLVDGQGNFGSIDGDDPAAMRYTEARMSRFAEEMLSDIDKDTVTWIPNFDETRKEPTVLPSRIPNLLINGTTGIAVGMATNMAPHNLKEVCDGIIAYIDNFDITVQELMQYIKGPDFPTGAIICGTKGIVDAYTTGRGKVVIRAKAEIEENENKASKIIITEIPFTVNKSLLIEKIADLVNNKKIDGISDIRDESDKRGLQITIDLKRDAVPQIVLNNLFANSALQFSFNINNVCLVKGRPLTLGLKDLIKYFYEHRHNVVVRRTKFELKQSKARIHILDGCIIALDNIDEIISLIKNSENTNDAIVKLEAGYNLDEIQSRSILDMKLQKLTGLEIDKIKREYKDLEDYIKRLENILNDDNLVKNIIKDEINDIKTRYGDVRKTQICEEINSMTFKDIVPDEDVVITLSNQGYIKRTLLSEYRIQNRGGIGAKASETKEEDFIKYIMISSTHKILFVFTTNGELYWKNVYDIPEGSKNAKGRAIQNLLEIKTDEKIACILSVNDLNDEDFLNKHYVVFCTKKGIVKKTLLKEYSRVRSKSIHAIKINNGDELLSVKITNGYQEIVIATHEGKAVRFNEKEIRPMGRKASGVRGINLGTKKIENNEVIGIVTIDQAIEKTLLVVSEKGFGKKSYILDYNVTHRGGKGVKTLNITEKTGKLVAIEDVFEDDELMIINKSGIAIRINVKDIRISGRDTQGVKLIKILDKDCIKSITKIENEKK